MNQVVTIRRLRSGEGQLFRRVRLAALAESPAAFGSSYESALQRTAASWRQQADGTVQGTDRATFLAFAAGRPVGITALYRDENRADVGELLQVWVEPAFRGRGVAGELLELILAWARENGFGRVVARVMEGNERALAFYDKHGFGVIGGGLTDGELVVSRDLVTNEGAG